MGFYITLRPHLPAGTSLLAFIRLGPLATPLIFNEIPEAVIVINANGQVVELNKAARHLKGLPPAVGIGTAIDDLFPEIADFDNAERITVTIPNSDDVRYLERTMRYLRRGDQIVGTLIMLHDVTIHHKAQQALDHAERRFTNVFRESPVPMVITTAGEVSRYLDANQAYLDLVGYEWEEIVGRGLVEMGIAIPNEERSKRREISLQYGGYSMRETQIRNRAGETLDVILSLQRLNYGNEVYDVEIILDVTERKRLERQYIEMQLEQERLILLRSFVQSISHEFRTPLATVNTLAYLMAKDENLDKRKRRAVLIENEVERLTQLVEMQIKIIKLESTVLDLTPVSLDGMIRRVCQLNGERVRCQLADNLPSVQIDEKLMQEALVILVNNALRYSPPDEPVVVSTQHDGGRVIIAVEDHGIGIAPENAENIFKTFWRLDKAHSTSGLGLGLPTARSIAQMHGGNIEFESTVGQGCIFRIVLPTYQST